MMILTISVLAILASLFSIMLKDKNPEISMLISIAATVAILLIILPELIPILDEIKALADLSQIESDNIMILFKALGICFITQFCADSCLDSGQRAMSSKVELAGKVSIAVIAMPLFRQVLQSVLSILGN